MKQYYVYIMASCRHGTLYIGVTSNLIRRAHEHRTYAVEGFTSKYEVDRLVYFEATNDVYAALSREKKLKGWRRNWKIELIEKENPCWVDLFPSICGATPVSMDSVSSTE